MAFVLPCHTPDGAFVEKTTIDERKM